MGVLRTRALPLKYFSGKRVAIDGHNWAYRSYAVANKIVADKTQVEIEDPNKDEIKRQWYSSCLDLVCLFLTHNVTPVFIFDGVSLPEKSSTQKARREEKIKARLKLDQLKATLRALSPIDCKRDMIIELRSLMSRSFHLERKEILEIMEFIASIGIPAFQAKGEAEQLCSALTINGYTSATYSEDTDNLVYGCPLLITALSDSYYDSKENKYLRRVICVQQADILATLQLSHQEFMDFCIMCGCDFNQRIPRIGPVKSYALIKEHRSIDALPDSYKVDNLCHHRCREIFTDLTYDEIDDLDVDKIRFYANGSVVLEDYATYLPRMNDLYSLLSFDERQLEKLPKRIILAKKKYISQD